jgi:hypothetical protein
MINKFISVVLFIFAITVLVFRSNGADPIFLFVSSNLQIDILRLALVSLVLSVSIQNYISSTRLRKSFKYFGLALAAFGLFGLMNLQVESFFYNYLKTLDFMVMAELGITMMILSLTAPSTMPHKKPAKTAKSYLLRSQNS